MLSNFPNGVPLSLPGDISFFFLSFSLSLSFSLFFMQFCIAFPQIANFRDVLIMNAKGFIVRVYSCFSSSLSLALFVSEQRQMDEREAMAQNRFSLSLLSGTTEFEA